MRLKKEFIKICPKCGSENTTGSGRLIQMGAGFSYCKSCGYEGIFPEVDESKIKKFRETIKERK